MIKIEKIEQVVKHWVPPTYPTAKTKSCSKHKLTWTCDGRRAYMCSLYVLSCTLRLSDSKWIWGRGSWICAAVINEGRGSERSLLDSQLEQIVLVLMCSTINNNVWKQRRIPFSHYCTCITSPTDSRLSFATHTHTHSFRENKWTLMRNCPQ